ncbi:hypothetical protein KAX03_00320 [Candidatus Bathyarchaeota archaeon]|nr:hypothetical protein [Candidatus Bathyarchaeota archaeon]
MRPASPKEEIIPIVKERLFAEDVKLLYLFNTDWQDIRKIRSLSERIKCPKCSSSLIAMTYRNDEELIKIAKRRRVGRKLSKEKEKKWLTTWRSASLI